MSQPADRRPEGRSVDERSVDQVAQERAMAQVSDVLLNLEHTIARARKGHKVVAKDGSNINVELALADLVRDLDRARKRFTQDTYFAVDDRLV